MTKRKRKHDARERAPVTAPAPLSAGLWMRVVLAVLALTAVLAAAFWFRPESREPGPETRAPTPQRAVDPEVYELLEQVQADLRNRRFEEGLAAVEEHLRDHPEDAGVYYARGLLNLGKLNYQEAIDALGRAVELDPAHPDAYLKLGTAYSRIGDLPEANRHLEKALDLDPAMVEARLLLGRNLARQGEYGEARSHFEQVVAALPAEGHFELGLLARQEEDLAAAEREFRRALAAEPRHLGATSNLGQVLKLQGRLAEGDRFLAHHVELEKERYAYDRLREQTLYDWAEAEGFVRLAAYELVNGKLDKAEGNFRKALEMDETYVEAAYGLGRTYLEMARLEEAGRWLERARELEPEHAPAHFFLGLVRHLQGRYEEARRELDRSRELAPWGGEQYLFLGNALFAGGAVEDARLAYEQSVAAAPEHPDAHLKLALLHYLSGRLEAARNELEQVLAVRPDDTDSRMFLGIVAFRLGDRPAAREAFLVALERHALTMPSEEQVETMLDGYADLPESGPALDLYRQLSAKSDG